MEMCFCSNFYTNLIKLLQIKIYKNITLLCSINSSLTLNMWLSIGYDNFGYTEIPETENWPSNSGSCCEISINPETDDNFHINGMKRLSRIRRSVVWLKKGDLCSRWRSRSQQYGKVSTAIQYQQKDLVENQIVYSQVLRNYDLGFFIM